MGSEPNARPLVGSIRPVDYAERPAPMTSASKAARTVAVGQSAWGDYSYLPAGHVVLKVPDQLADGMVAGINCAFATVMCGLDVARVELGETVVVQGAALASSPPRRRASSGPGG
ncbi:MAG TPA: hypothetical protein VFH48_14690 [Chloroflexota bacterium]|nr:hypothetical protein [Chloroflexota bacterium]